MRVAWLALLLASAMPALGAPKQEQADAQQLVRAANEVHARESGHTPWLYILRKSDAGKTEVREVVNTNDGPLFRTLSRNGQPLSGEQQSKENKRIQDLLHDPDKQREQARRFQHDLQVVLNLIKIVPDAFVFRIDGKEQEFMRLTFEPNPAYRPGTRAARVARAMRGTMLVHPEQKRLVELKGVITNDVKFGAGILGTIKKGGSFQFRQTQVAPRQWLTSLSASEQIV